LELVLAMDEKKCYNILCRYLSIDQAARIEDIEKTTYYIMSYKRLLIGTIQSFCSPKRKEKSALAFSDQGRWDCYT